MKFKHTTTFSAEIFAAKDIPKFTEQKDESLASLQDLAPSYWESKNVDLLAVAFDAAVINQFNANDDGIAANVAVQVMDKFSHKPINIEHDRSRIIGHITDAACTDRSTHDFIWEEDARIKKEPYNLSLGGFIYKMVDGDFYEELEDSMNPQSSNYHSISASWEVGFNSFAIALGSQEIQHAEIITNPIEVARYAEYLRAFGGDGYTEDGRRVYRLITGDVYPLGIGFVKNPAADVKGIHYYKDTAKCDETEKIAASNTKNKGFIANKESNISQSEKSNVKSLDSKLSMEELLKQLKEALASQDKVTEEVAANIAKQFAEKIKEADVEYRQKLVEKDEAIAKEKEEREALKSQVEEISDKLEAAEQTIQEFKDKEAQEALATARDQRLEQIDSLYDLDDEDRKVIIAELNNFDVTSDEEFEAYSNKLSVLLRHKNKEALAAKAKEEEEKKEMQNAKASKEEKEEGKAPKESKEDESLNRAKANEDDTPPNNNGEEESLVKKFSKAISKENVKIQF